MLKALILRLPKSILWICGTMLMFLLLMTLYRLYFFYHYRPLTNPFTGKTFLLGFRYDLRVVCVTAMSIMIISIFNRLNPFKNEAGKKFWQILLVIIFFIFLCFYIADFYHYDYLQQRLQASIMNYSKDAKISLVMMKESYPVFKGSIILICMLVIFFVFHKKLINNISKTKEHFLGKWKLISIYTVFTLLLALGIFGKMGQYPLRWSDAFTLSNDFKSNTALNPFQSFFSTMKFRNTSFDFSKSKKYYDITAKYFEIPNADSSTMNFERPGTTVNKGTNRPNIILVICESFSAYKSSMFGNKLNPTPYFNSLCQNGVFFERCFTPGFGTARGVWSVVTGIPDVDFKNTSSRNPSAVNQQTIINEFDGYQKYYFLGGNTTWANIRGLLKNNIDGLEIYEQENFNSGKVDVWGISDKNLFFESIKVLNKSKKPFFSIIQTADNHRPYTIPEEDLDEFKKVSYPDDTLTKYGFDNNAQLNAFRYSDFCFEKFIKEAKAQSFFENTIFVFVGDHGLRGNAGNMFPKSFTDQGILAEHVPLLFYSPTILKPARVHTPSSQLDVLPSLASLAGIKYTNTTMGFDLFDSTRKSERFAFVADPEINTVGIVSDKYYYRRNLITNKKEFVSVINDDIIKSDSVQNMLSVLSEGIFENAKYLLLHNKKRNKK